VEMGHHTTNPGLKTLHLDHHKWEWVQDRDHKEENFDQQAWVLGLLPKALGPSKVFLHKVPAHG